MRPINNGELATIKALYSEGLSLNAIGKKLNRHHGVISYRLRKEGIKIDTPGQRAERKVPTQIVIDLYQKGMSLPEIGEKFNMTAQGVHDRLLKTDIKIRSLSEAIKNSFKTGRAKRQRGIMENTLLYHCDNCGIGFDIKLEPCLGIEVRKNIKCPNCETQYYMICTVAIMEESD